MCWRTPGPPGLDAPPPPSAAETLFCVAVSNGNTPDPPLSPAWGSWTQSDLGSDRGAAGGPGGPSRAPGSAPRPTWHGRPPLFQNSGHGACASVSPAGRRSCPPGGSVLSSEVIRPIITGARWSQLGLRSTFQHMQAITDEDRISPPPAAPGLGAETSERVPVGGLPAPATAVGLALIHDEGQTQGWGRAPRPAATGSSWAPSPAGTVLLGTGGTVLCPGPSGPSDPGLGPQWPHPAEEPASWAQSPLALIPLCSGLRVGPWPPRCWGPSWPVPTRRCRRRSAEAPRGARPLLGACARAVSDRGRDELCSRRAVTVKNVAAPWSPAARPRRAPAPHLSAASGRALRGSGRLPGPRGGADHALPSLPAGPLPLSPSPQAARGPSPRPPGPLSLPRSPPLSSLFPY